VTLARQLERCHFAHARGRRGFVHARQAPLPRRTASRLAGTRRRERPRPPPRPRCTRRMHTRRRPGRPRRNRVRPRLDRRLWCEVCGLMSRSAARGGCARAGQGPLSSRLRWARLPSRSTRSGLLDGIGALTAVRARAQPRRRPPPRRPPRRASRPGGCRSWCASGSRQTRRTRRCRHWTWSARRCRLRSRPTPTWPRAWTSSMPSCACVARRPPRAGHDSDLAGACL